MAIRADTVGIAVCLSYVVWLLSATIMYRKVASRVAALPPYRHVLQLFIHGPSLLGFLRFLALGDEALLELAARTQLKLLKLLSLLLIAI